MKKTALGAFAALLLTICGVVGSPTRIVLAHHPLVSAVVPECIAPGATTYPVEFRVVSDAPDRGKEYHVDIPADAYAPAGWVGEATPFTRHLDIPIGQNPYTEKVSVTWRNYDGDASGPTGVTGLVTVEVPPTCVVPTAAVEATGAADCDGAVQQWTVTVTGTDWPEGATVTVVGQVESQLKSGLKPGDTFTVSWKPSSWQLTGTGLGGYVPTTATPPDNCPESSPATVLTPASCTSGGSILLENAAEATGEATFFVTISQANTSLQRIYSVDAGQSLVVDLGLKPGESIIVTVAEGEQTLLDFVTVTRPGASACGGVIPPTE